MTKPKRAIATREQFRPVDTVLAQALEQQPAAELWGWLHVLMQAYEALWPQPGAAVVLKRIGTARDVLAEELHKQRRVQAYFPNLVDLLDFLDTEVCLEMTGEVPPSARALRISLPRGPRLGGQRDYQRSFMSEEEFEQKRAESIAKLRAELRCAPTATQIYSDMGITAATYYKYLNGAPARTGRIRMNAR